MQFQHNMIPLNNALSCKIEGSSAMKQMALPVCCSGPGRQDGCMNNEPGQLTDTKNTYILVIQSPARFYIQVEKVP